MLGLFMILPIFALYARHLDHHNATLIGLALGIYGATQALLQIPFGMLSDKIGRKPIIVFGLLLFAAGSIIAAESTSIYGIIFGRALQGAGAIGSTLIATVADNTKEENRTKAMGMIGMTIGASFVVAIILGPLLNGSIGVPGIFWLTAILAALGILIVLFVVPKQRSHLFHRDNEPVLSLFGKMLKDSQLLRLDLGIFVLHATLTAIFIALPLSLFHFAGLSEAHQWYVYLPVLIISFLVMVPLIIIAEAKRKMKQIFVGCVFVIMATQFFLTFFHSNAWVIGIILLFFFTAFTTLEASLPSLIAKMSPAGSKGTAMGIYSSSQFLGIFVGGLGGGFCMHHFGLESVFLFTFILGIIWFLAAFTMQAPKYLSSKVVAIDASDDQAVQSLREKFLAVSGIADVMVDKQEQVAYLKVDKKQFTENSIQHLIKES
jgi:MFS family permease